MAGVLHPRRQGRTNSVPCGSTAEKDNPRELVELCIVANFVEVYLARQGHSNPVGINFLEKIQPAHLPCIYGAMLAGVGYVVMGAGIPLKIPGVLDRYVEHQPAEYTVHVHGAQEGDDNTMRFDPREYMSVELGPLSRPKFLPIVSSNTLATTILKKANGRVDGLVIETRTAGGHNAPPRGKLQLSEPASRSMASGTRSTSPSCVSWACRSGWPEDMGIPRRCGRRWRRELRACRWGRHSSLPGSLACARSSKMRCWQR